MTNLDSILKSRDITLPANAGNIMRHGFDTWVSKVPWRRAWKPTSEFLDGESHGQRRLVGSVHSTAKSQTVLKGFDLQSRS